MPIFGLPSTRLLASQREGQPDVYVYDKAPAKLRVQIAFLFSDALGRWSMGDTYAAAFMRAICREHGRSIQQYDWHDHPLEFLIDFIKRENPSDNAADLEVIDLVELLLNFIGSEAYQSSPSFSEAKIEGIINEANHRLTQNGVGWRYERPLKKLICLADEFTHASMVRPALAMLGTADMKKANEEFLNAFDQFRSENWKDAISAAGRSFEAVLKSICNRRGWPYEQHDNAKKLLQHCRQGGLFPEWLDTTLARYYWDMLEHSIPRTRNKTGGHGDGPEADAVTADLATFALHQTAANILLVLQREKALAV